MKKSKRLVSYLFLGISISILIAGCNQFDEQRFNEPQEKFSNFVSMGETKIDFSKNVTKVDLTDAQAVTEYVKSTYRLTGEELQEKVAELQALPPSGEIIPQQRVLLSDCTGTVGVGRAYYFGRYVAATLGTLTCSTSHWSLSVSVYDRSGSRSGYWLFGRSLSAHTDGVDYKSVAGTYMCGNASFSLRIGTTLYSNSGFQCSFMSRLPN